MQSALYSPEIDLDFYPKFGSVFERGIVRRLSMLEGRPSCSLWSPFPLPSPRSSVALRWNLDPTGEEGILLYNRSMLLAELCFVTPNNVTAHIVFVLAGQLYLYELAIVFVAPGITENRGSVELSHMQL